MPDYQCVGESIQAGAPRCLTVPGAGIDAAIGQLLLDTVTPLALEVALTVQAELEARADEADALRRSHVERARHHADLARRRYLAVDPDNRLVADSLEADWNDALRQLQAAQDDYERASRRRASALERRAQGPHPCPRRRLPRPVVRPRHPAARTQTHGPAAHRRRHPRQDRPDPPPRPLPRRPDHQPHHPHPADRLARPARPTPTRFALLDRLLDDHTDAEVADALNAAGHRSGDRPALHPPASCCTYAAPTSLPSHAERLRARGLLTIDEIAERLDVHPSTIKAWHHAGLLISHKANDKNERLYEPPTPGDPRLVKRMGSRLANRVPIEPTPGGAV